MPILVRLLCSHPRPVHAMLKLTVTEMQNRLMIDAKVLRVPRLFLSQDQDFSPQDQDQTLIFVVDTPRDQDFVLDDNITAAGAAELQSEGAGRIVSLNYLLLSVLITSFSTTNNRRAHLLALL